MLGTKCLFISGISIHTPTQGVTDLVKWLESKERISIHTPTQGVTELRDLFD